MFFEFLFMKFYKSLWADITVICKFILVFVKNKKNDYNPLVKPRVKNKTMSVFGDGLLNYPPSINDKPGDFLPYAKFPIGII